MPYVWRHGLAGRYWPGLCATVTSSSSNWRPWGTIATVIVVVAMVLAFRRRFGPGGAWPAATP